MTRNTGKYCAQHTEPIISILLRLIRSVYCDLSIVEIEPVTAESKRYRWSNGPQST